MKEEKIRRKDMPRLKKKYRRKKQVFILNKVFQTIVILICLGGIGYSSFNLVVWYLENKRIDAQIMKINDVISLETIEEIEEPGPTPEEPIKEEKPNDYFDYMQIPLIKVDFSKLKEINNETVAFLKVNGTNINYPVVQTDNNDFYLKHAFDKSYNSAGWVFMDYRNDANELQDNTIIYAHGRVNSTMFGSLKNVFKSDWYNDANNYVVNLVTEKQSTLWQVFSVYHIPTETYYLTSSFGTKESHEESIKTIMDRSLYDFKTTVSTDDKILTLSTCYNKEEKVVLHAKLIKKQIF